MPGYDRNRFRELRREEEDEFTCGICQDILKKPVIVPCCRQTYCEDCIQEWLTDHQTCPNDRSNLNRNSLTQPPVLVVNLLAKLKIQCDFASDGCDNVCQLDRLTHHLTRECHYNPYRKCQSCGALKEDAEQFRMIEDENVGLKIQCSEQQEMIDELQTKLTLTNRELDKYRSVQSRETLEHDNENKLLREVEELKILAKDLKRYNEGEQPVKIEANNGEEARLGSNKILMKKQNEETKDCIIL